MSKLWWSPMRLIESMTMYFDLGGDAPDMPDPDPNIGAAQKKLAEVAQQTEDRLARESAANMDRNSRLEPVIDSLFRSQVNLSNSQTAIADANQARLTSSIWPIERTLMADALGYYDASPEMAAALEKQMRSSALSSYGYDSRLAQLDSDRAAYERQLADYNAGMSSAAIDRAAIEKELTSKFTYTREDPGMSAYIGGDPRGEYQWMPGRPASTTTTVDQEGLNRAVENRIEELMKQQSGVSRPTERDFDAERAAIERSYGGYLGQIDSEIEAMRLYKDSDLAARESAARDAAADVQGRFAGANAGQRLEMARMGVGPDSGRYASMMSGNAAMEAAASAAAMNQARTAAKQLGWAKRMDSAALGRGLPGSQATSTGLALQGLGGAQNSALVPSNLAAQQQQLANQGASTVAGMYGQIGQLGVQSYNSQLGAWSAANQAAAAESSGFGSFLGSLGAAAIKQWSDRRLKTDIVKLGELPDNIGVYAFTYIESGNRDVGVMADEVEKVYPDAVSEVRGYKMVDYSYFDDALEVWRRYAERRGLV
jgi:hypothetical protein